MHEWYATVTPAAPVEAPLAQFSAWLLESGACRNRRELRFFLLNRTQRVIGYDRAVFFEYAGGRPRVRGVSGEDAVESTAPSVQAWQQVAAALEAPADVQVLDDEHAPAAATWSELSGRTEGLAVLWLPIVVDGRLRAALWIERWQGRRFTPGENRFAESASRGAAVAWRATAPRRLSRLLNGLSRGRAVAIAAVVLIALLVLVPVRLRIVAPCEVVPAEPHLVAAPLGGVIAELLVEPGAVVTPGTLLARYDGRVVQQELRMAEQQVAMIAADLERARAAAFDDPATRAEVALLTARLAQEEARLEIARDRAARLEVTAPVGGTLVFDDPSAWQGRPVQLGERILTIADPERSKLLIRLPVADRLAFDTASPVTVLFDADPAKRVTAELRFVANHAETATDGRSFFRAEGQWAGDVRGQLGERGSAVLYGDEVSLGYWLLRRPLGTVRRFLGI
jgi:multidrug resistance efflux pump